MLPSTGITTTLVGNTLGITSKVVRILCTSGNINKWSRYKPVGSGNYVNTDPNWYKGGDGWCGFEQFRIDSNVLDHYKNGTAWKYVVPDHKLGQKYRLGDFRNYEHLSSPFFKTNVSKDQVITWEKNVNDYIFSLNAIHNKPGNPNLITADFAGLLAGMDSSRFAVDIYTSNPITNTGITPEKQLLSDTRVNDTSVSSHIVKLTSEMYFSKSVLYCVLYLSDDSGSKKYPIPYNDSNYFMVQINSTIVNLVTLLPTAAASYPSNSTYRELRNINELNPLPVNDGRFQIRCTIINNLTSPIYVNNTNYKFEAKIVQSGKREEGTLLNSDFSDQKDTIIIQGKQNSVIYINFWNLLSTSYTGRLNVLLYLSDILIGSFNVYVK